MDDRIDHRMNRHEVAGFAPQLANPGGVSEASMRRAIARKRDGAALGADEWYGLIGDYLAGTVDDAQMAALLMASVIRGLDAAETRALTEAFVASGESLAPAAGHTVDKHSSGGVGDTASLIVVPLVAACGLSVAKLSGRALGHTGGTLDKLEALAGVRTDLSPENFIACVREAGCSIAAQSERLVPADRRIYALRDRTSTVPSLGLIAASIVSKKIAGGAQTIVYDVKSGNGAFLRDPREAIALAETLVSLTRGFGRTAAALVTDMDEPLGPAIGTGIELIAARDFLRGDGGSERLAAVCDALSLALLANGGFSGNATGAIRAALESGAAYDRFERMLVTQGARPGALAALARHPKRTSVVAPRDGYVTAIDCVRLGEAARDLVAAAGPFAGIVMETRIGRRTFAGDGLATIFGEGCDVRGLAAAFTIGDDAPPARPLVYFETATASASGT